MVVPIYQVSQNDTHGMRCQELQPTRLKAEISPPHARAFIMSIESIMTAFGYVIANWIGYGSSFNDTSFQWRFPLSIQVLFALIVLCAGPWLPGELRLFVVSKDEELIFTSRIPSLAHRKG